MDLNRIVADRLDGWVPIRVSCERTEPVVEWCYVGARRFEEPFFDETVRECFRSPFSVLFRHQTSMATLAERARVRPGLPPDGFIFHMSRSGSTLVAQLLSTLPDTVVISEAGPIDAVLRAHLAYPEVSDEVRVEWLRWIVSALGQRRSGDERHFFVKFDSWSILAFDVVRRAFPDVPWIFLFRDPVDVLVSQLARRSAHLVPGVLEPALVGLDEDSARALHPAAFCAHVLARVCDAALEAVAAGRGLLVNYRTVPEEVFSTVAHAFHLHLTADNVSRMRERALLDAKNPFVLYATDALQDRRAREAATEAASLELIPLYDRLEALRVSRADIGRA
jgi:gluconate kinase